MCCSGRLQPAGHHLDETDGVRSNFVRELGIALGEGSNEASLLKSLVLAVGRGRGSWWRGPIHDPSLSLTISNQSTVRLAIDCCPYRCSPLNLSTLPPARIQWHGGFKRSYPSIDIHRDDIAMHWSGIGMTLGT